MPLSINQYSTWATQNMGSEVALSKGAPGLDRASNQVGALARFFGTQSAQNVRKEVMADFTRALSSRYGVSLAHQALAEAGLTPTSKLDGKTIKAVIKLATDIRAAEVDSLMEKDIRLLNRTITPDDVKDYSKMAMKSYLSVRCLVIDTLGEMPLDVASYNQFCERCDALITKLKPLTDALLPTNDPTEQALREDATALVRALDNKMDELEALLEGKPLSDENVQNFKNVWALGFGKALVEIAKNSSPALQEAMQDVVDGYQGDLDAFYESLPVVKDFDKMLAKKFIEDLKQHIPAKSITFKEDFLAKQISIGYRQALNEGDWAPISKTFTASVGGIPVSIKSDIVPGASIGAPSADAKGPIGRTYDPGVNGYMCHSAGTKHAVNLAVSSITLDGADQPAFRGIRHGVHCAWEISSPSERAAANVKRAEEAVIAAFLADPANERKIENGEIKLNMVSVSLLTPDIARHVKPGRSSDERLMLREQKAAWDAVSQNGVTFQHNGRTITIRPTVYTFNFGVNAGAVKYSSVAPNLAGGWGMSDDMNMRAHRQMRPLVEAFVNDTSIPADKRKAVLTLFNQCMPVLRKGGERSDDHDAYKVAARFAVLTHLMGWTPCWNCKSGKDRTGQMDVECKFLATLVARGEDIPEPGAKLTKEQTALFRAIAFEAGNFEMQQYNTGIGGYKTSGVSSIPERLGGQEYREFHKGGSSSVGV